MKKIKKVYTLPLSHNRLLAKTAKKRNLSENQIVGLALLAILNNWNEVIDLIAQ